MTGTILPKAAVSTQPPVSVDPQVAAETPNRDSPRSPRPAATDAPTSTPRLRDDPRVAVLISTIVHTLIFMLLALFSYRPPRGNSASLVARQGAPSASMTFESSRATDSAIHQQSHTEQPVSVVINTIEPIQVPSPTEQASDLRSDPMLQSLHSAGAGTNRSAAFRLPGGGLSGRTPEGRVEYGRKYGATAESEQAVDMALQWLAEHQRPNGSWSFDLELDPCNGRCRHGKKKGSDTPTPSTAATGLALLAFLGAGHSHHVAGPYQETVRRGIYYLRAVAGESAAGLDWQQGSMYGHGIALMALAEAMSMASKDDRKDSDLFELVQGGNSFTCIAQHGNGSWGYVPGSPGDTTVTGWQVLSLIAARRNGIPPHTNTLRDAKSFLMSTCEDRDYWFGYKGPPGEPTTTAIGLTLMLYLGESPGYTPFYLALTDLAERGPMLTNVYHDYYGTLALHHSRHPDWDRWNTKLRDHLVATQAKEGHETGSWHFPDRWGDVGGRLYTTAMCTMILEVYYRYLPLYESIEDFPL